MSLDTSRLEKFRPQGTDHVARCPACALTGGDTAGDHLIIDPQGKFGCVLHQGADGAAHRTEIFNLVGIKTAAKEKSIWTALPSAPETAPAPTLNHFKLGTPSAHWTYRTDAGRIAGITARFETATGKETRPLTWCKDQHGNTAWRWKAQAEPRTIYGLPINDRAVVIVEGEKTAEAVKSAGLPATTWQGGAGTVSKSDWTPLAGKICFIWPDNDLPGSKAKNDLIAALAPIAAEIRVVSIPEGLPEGWDAADTTPAEIRRLVDEAVVVDPAYYPKPVEPAPDPQPEAPPQPQAAPGEKRSIIIDGVNIYPTIVPPETVLLGNDWLRLGDIAHFISTAGAGKSVAMFQMAMAWGLGLPYMGIKPARALRILIFSGEDDGTTIGQCREGFLEHSEAITGVDLTGTDLVPLDNMIRTEFSREYVGELFHGHLSKLLTDSPADLVLINPLLSYLGGEVVAVVSAWLRAGLMPILQQHDCAAMIAHHTPKMAKDGWDNTDDTYSAIGGGEVANIPRAILTLRPTPSDGLSVVTVSKRQTTGWRDGQGKYATKYFVRRSENPSRPAWIPVPFDEAEASIGTTKAAQKAAAAKKATPDHVVEALKIGPTEQKTLIERLMAKCQCGERTGRDAIIHAEGLGFVSSFTETNPRGGKSIKWLCLPEHQPQVAK